VPEFWSALGNTLLYALLIVVFISYLFALFAVVGDLFRDHKLSGWWKAVWIVLLIWIPFLTLLVYLIARGAGMATRAEAAAKQQQAAADDYIRSVAGSPSDEIARAKALLDAGTISADEYAALKAKALA
jgi:NADH:ubiquinone oxidoreductase subunit 6 (subunit J)